MFHSFAQAGPPKKRHKLTDIQYLKLANLLEPGALIQPISIYLEHLQKIPENEILDRELYNKIQNEEITIDNIRTALAPKNELPPFPYKLHSFVLHPLWQRYPDQEWQNMFDDHQHFIQDMFDEYKYVILQEMRKEEKKEEKKEKKKLQQAMADEGQLRDELLSTQNRLRNVKSQLSTPNKLSDMTARLTHNKEKYENKLQQLQFKLQQLESDRKYVKFLSGLVDGQETPLKNPHPWKCLEKRQIQLNVKIKDYNTNHRTLQLVRSKFPTWPIIMQGIKEQIKNLRGCSDQPKEQETLNNLIILNDLECKQLDFEYEIPDFQQYVEWATRIYTNADITKKIKKILRIGYKIEKWKNFEPDKVQEQVTDQQKKQNELNNLILAIGWQMLYSLQNGKWTLQEGTLGQLADDTEYLEYFIPIWSKSHKKRVPKEFQKVQRLLCEQEEVQENLKVVSFKLFQQLRIIEESKKS